MSVESSSENNISSEDEIVADLMLQEVDADARHLSAAIDKEAAAM